ncbi:MAG: gluconate 2-dehydrogenase subunit 3 family protein [Terriglobia bacterium]
MKRRTALKIVALSSLAPSIEAMGTAVCHPSMGRVAWSAQDYKLRFFTEHENKTLDQVMELIIPADHHSPGAHAAQVSLFADLMISSSGKGVQKQWRDGIRQMQEAAANSSLAEALAAAAAHEGHATNDSERFFAALKDMTVNGYYTSAIGIHQDLQYQGNTYLNAFPGCTLKQLVKRESAST